MDITGKKLCKLYKILPALRYLSVYAVGGVDLCLVMKGVWVQCDTLLVGSFVDDITQLIAVFEDATAHFFDTNRDGDGLE